MNRVTIFAHYDKNNLIQDYVVYYLRELKKVSGRIIFVSDSEISEKELFKISDVVDYSIVHRHGEYDFGSYKRGFIYAKENGWLQDCDELVLCNDSCYGPIFDIEKYFKEMSSRKVDFWGNTANPGGVKNYAEALLHVQSYFIVFKPQVFNSKEFCDFMTSVQQEDNKKFIIVKYEMGLTKMLAERGFLFDVYCESSKTLMHSHMMHYKTLIEKDKNPFVKTSIYRLKDVESKVLPSYRVITQNSDYDIKLIKKDLKFNQDRMIIFRKPLSFLSAMRRSVMRLSFRTRTIRLFDKEYKF